jgi:hypothetical protein
MKRLFFSGPASGSEVQEVHDLRALERDDHR